MCDIHTMPGAAPPPAPEPAPRQQPIEGWACDYRDDEWPVIADPKASAAALLAWGVGELSQLNILLEAANAASSAAGLQVSDVAGAALHFTQQVRQAMEAALARLD
ncbi:MAG: hypothetical protein QM750_23180 [Rubrivivax sp.]